MASRNVKQTVESRLLNNINDEETDNMYPYLITNMKTLGACVLY